MLTSKEKETIENLEELRTYLSWGYFRDSVQFILDVDEAIKAIKKVAQIREDLDQVCAGCKRVDENVPCTLNCDKEWAFRWE